MLLSRNLALIGPLSTTLGIEDVYDMIEVIQIDAYNNAILDKQNRE